MKYKILGDMPPEAATKQKYIVQSFEAWECEKCKILYGQGEEILMLKGAGKFCPIHTNKKILTADMDYWMRKKILQKID